MAVFINDTLVVVKAIRSALLADTELSTGVAGQVYYKLIPDGFTYPFAFIDINAATEDNSAGTNLSNFNMLVKIVSVYKTDYEASAILAGRIYGLLHEVDLSDSGEGWHIWRSQRETIIDFIEQVAGKTYSNIGGIYTVRLSS